MRILEGPETYSTFLERLQSAPERILLLDYDGTLAPFRTERDKAFPYSEVPPLVSKIMKRGTRVVLISGRSARELAGLSTILPHPEIWGSHGLERLLPDDSYEIRELPVTQRTGLALALRSLRSEELRSELGAEIENGRVERKPGGIAVHWRGLAVEEAEKWQTAISRLWTPLLAEYSLSLLNFDGGTEIKAAGEDKGKAVGVIQTEADSRAAIAYLGDDQTDEDAFKALKGKGLTVLVRPQYRPTAADVWLQPPHELIGFFHDWLGAMGGEA